MASLPGRSMLAAPLAALALIACFGGTDGPSGLLLLDLPVVPRFELIPSPADGTALPVYRIRAVTTIDETGALLDDLVVDVSPTAPSWTIDIVLPALTGEMLVVVTIHLLHVASDGAESIQFSGRTSPFIVGRGEPTSPAVPLVRGPLSNLYTTSVTITSAPASLLVGAQATLTASATVSQGPGAAIYWTSLDPDLLTLDGATATALAEGTARVVASAGAFADTAQIRVSAPAGGPATLLGSFNPDLGSIVSVAIDPVSTNLFLYPEFGAQILVYTQAGAPAAPGIPRPGLSSNDIDLDFLPVGANVAGTNVPANALLVVNGEANPGTVFALSKDDGTVLSSFTLPSGTGNPVGGAYHTSRDVLLSVDWTTDVITEIDLTTGSAVGSYTVLATGAPAYDVFYGDADVNPATDNVLVVSSSYPAVRVLSASGAWVRDVDLAPLGVAGLSGIAWDESTRTAWLVSTNGTVHHVDGLD